jgi:hypothetical protein
MKTVKPNKPQTTKTTKAAPLSVDLLRQVVGGIYTKEEARK